MSPIRGKSFVEKTLPIESVEEYFEHFPVLEIEKDNRKIMKNPDRETVSRLEALPNIGKAMANKLQLIGIDNPRKLLGKEPFELYEALCIKSGKRHDPCVIDVFMSVIHFMEGGEPLPWWSFTDERKKLIIQNQE